MAQFLHVTREDGVVRLRLDESVILESETTTELVEKAHALGDSAPLELEMDTSVRLSLRGPDRAVLLAALHPVSDLVDELYDQWEAAGEPSSFEFDEPPSIETGVNVDDERWGWMYLLADDQWQLIPQGTSQTIFDLTVGFDGASMTSGMVFDTGLRRWPTNHGVSWYVNPDGGDSSLNVLYEIQDWESVVLDLIGFESWPWCTRNNHPYIRDHDEEEYKDAEDEGWSASLDLDDSLFSDEFIGNALQRIWVPCKLHREEDDLSIFAVGRRWLWTGTTWVPESEDLK
jgi:hypothetical protein